MELLIRFNPISRDLLQLEKHHDGSLKFALLDRLEPILRELLQPERGHDWRPKFRFFCEAFWCLADKDTEFVTPFIKDFIKLLSLEGSLPLAKMVIPEFRGTALPLDMSICKKKIMDGIADLRAKTSEVETATPADLYDALLEKEDIIFQDAEFSRTEAFFCNRRGLSDKEREETRTWFRSNPIWERIRAEIAKFPNGEHGLDTA